MVVGLTACSSGGGSTSDSSGDAIKIGFSGPLTGDASIYGLAVQHGAEIAVEEVNEYQKTVLFNKLAKRFGGEANLKGKTIAMWGLAFKPETDDMREATALVLIDKLTKAGAIVRVYDPVAMNECKRRVGDIVTYCNDMYEALLDADALLLVTEWKQFRMPSFGVMKKSMKNALIIDGRNIYDAKELADAGFEYSAIGC